MSLIETTKPKVLFNWSGGKDSALALQKLLEDDNYDVIALLTTVNQSTNKSSIHGIPIHILQQQANSIGIELFVLPMSENLADYEQKMKDAIIDFKTKGVTHFAFGDIFLSDIKTYREKQLNPFGIEVLTPLWNQTSEEVFQDFLNSGIKSVIIVTQADKLDKSFVGQTITQSLALKFPNDIDVCGENGEYHTLSYAGKLFKQEIEFTIADIKELSFNVTMENGETKMFYYWQAELF